MLLCSGVYWARENPCYDSRWLVQFISLSVIREWRRKVVWNAMQLSISKEPVHHSSTALRVRSSLKVEIRPSHQLEMICLARYLVIIFIEFVQASFVRSSWYRLRLPSVIHPLSEMDHRKHPVHTLVPPQSIISLTEMGDLQIHMIRSRDFIRFTIHLRCRIEQFLKPF